jgi:hypothetical protein
VHVSKIAAATTKEETDEVHVSDMPARCAAEYLEMHDIIEKRNLICKIDVFLNSSTLCIDNSFNRL